MMKRHWLLLLTATILLSGCKDAQIQWDPAYDFQSIRTFAWQETPATSLADSDPFMHSRIVAAIEYQLTADGLTQVQDNPDVWVTYHTRTEDRVRLRSNSFGYGFGSYGLGDWDYWGYGYGGPVSFTTSTDVIEYEEDTLVVDIWDADAKQLVLRGTVTRVLSQSPQAAERQIDKAVAKMAEQAKKLMGRTDR